VKEEGRGEKRRKRKEKPFEDRGIPFRSAVSRDFRETIVVVESEQDQLPEAQEGEKERGKKKGVKTVPESAPSQHLLCE